jgi:hypothetical protein
MGNGNGAASNANGILLQCGTNSGGGGLAACTIKVLSGSATADGNNAIVGGTLVLAITCGQASDSTIDHIYINGVEVGGYNPNPQVGLCGGLQTVGNYVVGGTATGNGFTTVDSGTWCVCTIYHVATDSAFYSAAKVAQATAILLQDLQQNHGVTTYGEFSTSAVDGWLPLGDSISAGSGTLTLPWPLQITLNGTWQPASNVLPTGGTTAEMIQAACTNGQLNALYSANANRNVMVHFAGTNSFVQSRTAAQTWNAIATCGAALKKAGYKAIVVTMLSRSQPSPQDTNKNLLNTLIRTNAVPIYFDSIADAAEDIGLGADGASVGASFQGDGIHPTQGASSNNLTPVIQKTFNALFGNLSFSTANTYASGAPAATAVTAASESVNTITITTTLNPGVGRSVSCTGITPAGYNSPTDGWRVITSSASSFTAYTDTTGLGAGTVFGSCSVPQMTEVDIVVNLNNTGNHTLISCVGWPTDKPLVRKNINAGAVTIVPWGAELVNGNATYVLGSNASVTLYPVLISASAAGCNWRTIP